MLIRREIAYMAAIRIHYVNLSTVTCLLKDIECNFLAVG